MSKRFPWIFSILWLIILMVMLWAGFWQLGRAEEKRAINQRMTDANHHMPTHLNDWQQLNAFDHVDVIGEFAATHFLLDNQIMDGQVGYFVLSAFKTEHGMWLLINRGWHSGKPVDLDVENKRIKLEGLLGDWPRPGIQLGEQVILNQAVQHVTYLPQEQVLSMLKTRLCKHGEDNECIILPVVLKLLPDAEFGYIRKWSLPRMTAEKHQAYAIQWFTMSLVLCLAYVIFLKKLY